MKAMSSLLTVAAMAVLTGVIVLAGCTATIETGPARPQACTMESAPVCGQRGTQFRTFLNSCLARADGFRVAHAGQCRMSAAICTREFRPVCGQRGNQLRSFSNSCLARAEGFSVIHPGECRPARPPRPAPIACTLEEAPVCAQRGNRIRSFGNECMARANGYRVLHAGSCR